jgi:phosphopantothenoylcysteine decarboxylase/phosphopantothenate--cysteine ligase
MHILVTAGPTREYLDDVRYLSNASSGRMGYAIAAAALRRGHQVDLVSGPVALSPPDGARLVSVVTAEQMYQAALARFDPCDGVIAAAAVCDYRPIERIAGKIKKSGKPLSLQLVETRDVLAELGHRKQHQWLVGFAVEAEDGTKRAVGKLHSKNCDAIVLNSPNVIGADVTDIQIIDRSARVVESFAGPKSQAAEFLLDWIEGTLVAG